ncbi:ImmA/IrrE family metallo-endopeptidase [Methylorubrum extorquens]|uniref:ImmA/IrrE family metallo-endopeptidase n=1 Tax=Methylorubrum extorquens TaxID=408 RepID=UPI001EE61B69|nr:XRE family transcriptional regulator [Methylorubrum extorquens]MCG5249513.1 XRE family transcriptional regulator [Methylorubrum extorquens]
MTPATTGIRLKALREARGLSQEQLARVFGFENRQTVAQIEAGQRKLSAEELVTAVREFDVPLDHFTNPYLIVGEARFSWRREGGLEEAEVNAFEARAGEWIGAYRELGRATGKGVSPLRHRLGLVRGSSYEEAEADGEAVAEALRLGPVPSARLAEAMQVELSTLVLMVDARPGISGAACLLRDLGAVLVNRNEPAGRRNYDLAHELFHLLTWDAMPPERIDDGVGSGKIQKRVEQMANKFASALLMPREVLARHCGPEIDAAWLNRTATALGVSAVALKWRMVSLGLMEQEAAKAFDDRLLRNNGATAPHDGEIPPLFGRPFMEVMAAGIGKGLVSVRRVARLLDVTIDELGELFAVHGIPRPFDM